MKVTPDWHRRALLAGGAFAVFGWVKGVPYLASLGEPDFAFEDLPGLAPFRRLIGTGSATTGAAIFAGLDVAIGAEPEVNPLAGVVRANPCSAIYGTAQTRGVPIAVFSDFSCPVCKVMDDRLLEAQARDPNGIRIVRHQLPILGVASATASRAVLAAEQQGTYREMHARLIRSPAVTNEAYIAAIAESLGLDRNKLLTDMRSDKIARQLQITAAIAEVFGFFGTPTFAIGRTVFMGSMSTRSLEKLVSEEIDNPYAKL